MSQFVSLNLVEAKEVYYRYWELGNNLPKEEKSKSFMEWLYCKGFVVRRSISGVGVSEELGMCCL